MWREYKILRRGIRGYHLELRERRRSDGQRLTIRMVIPFGLSRETRIQYRYRATLLMQHQMAKAMAA